MAVALPYCPGDNSFGPSVVGCREDFDFTVKFENIFLSLLPTTLFTTLSLFRIWQLFRTKILVTGWSWLAIAKLLSAVGYSTLRLSILIASIRLGAETELSSAARSLTFVLSICMLPLTVLEHSRSMRPSFLLNVYLLFSTLFDITQTRTQWLISIELGKGQELARLCTAAVAVKLVWLVEESQRKTTSTGSSLEESSGLFHLVAYTWLNPLFRKGYLHVLYLKDLAKLDRQLATEVLHQKLSTKVSHARANLANNFGLVRVLVRTLWASLLLPVLPRLALVGFRFCQPFVIHSLLSYMKTSQPERDVAWKSAGYGFIGAAVIIYFGVAVSTALYWYCHERLQVMVRGALVAAVYQTLTQLRTVDVNDSAAVTLMSTDIERIRVGLVSLHEFWATPVEAALACWLLYGQLGVAFVAPLALVTCSVIGSSILNRYAGPRQKRWMERIQTRVSETAHMLANIKQLKISALAQPVEDSTQQLRVDEMAAATKFRRLYVSNMAFGFAPMALCPLITFAVAARNLDTGTVFTSLAYLVLLADPLGFLFGEIPYLVAAFTSMGRIQEFLLKDVQEDHRQFGPGSPRSSASDTDGKSKMGPGITIKSATIGWTKDSTVFEAISIEIPPSSLTMVVGPVGSGKSTLCKAVLAEIPFMSGGVSITTSEEDFRSAFCDQTPYIHNGTVRENIIGTAPFDEARYREVIESAALSKDLMTLSQGDETIVGSSGMTLSGGQKQRIAMARALYRQGNFYVFDDSLSGLDADTELEVFVRALGPNGLLARRRSTILLATHNVKFLPMAQHIIALDSDGTLIYQGSYDDLAATGLYPLDETSLRLTASDEETPTPPYQDPIEQTPLLTGTSHTPTDVNNNGTSFLSEKDRMTGDSTVYRYYLASLGKISVIAFLFFGLGWGFFYNFGYIWLRFWSNDTGESHSRAFYIGLYAVWQTCGLTSIVLCFWTSYTMMAAISGLSLHRSALRSVIHAPLWFSTTTDIGVITNLFSQDMTLVDNELPMAITNLSLDVFNALGLAAVIATSSPYLAITYPALIGILYLVQKVFLRTSRQIRLLDLEAKSPLYTHFLDTSKGLATIRAFGWARSSITEAFRLLDESQKPTYLLAMVQRWLLFVLQCIVACLAIMVVTLATQVPSNTSGFTGASLVALMTFGDILNFIIRWWTQLETSIGAVTRLKALTDKVPSEGCDDQTEPTPPEWTGKGNIEIQGVSASYQSVDTQSLQEKPPQAVLENLNLSIASGEKVAICGRSGSGKSSLILLLLRMLDPLPSSANGTTIGGINLRSIARADVRRHMIAMSQDPVFLPGHISLKRQLDPFNLSSLEECHAVIRLVELSSLAINPTDLEAPLRPESLSGGQRQLLNLARAVLRGRARSGQIQNGEEPGGLLLLDEVSASMDHQTERIMQRVIMNEFDGYTIIMVSHRLEMTMDFDTVLVMEQGRVVERGHPRHLALDSNSHFGQLWLASGNHEFSHHV